jgi:hypothetical protein
MGELKECDCKNDCRLFVLDKDGNEVTNYPSNIPVPLDNIFKPWTTDGKSKSFNCSGGKGSTYESECSKTNDCDCRIVVHGTRITKEKKTVVENFVIPPPEKGKNYPVDLNEFQKIKDEENHEIPYDKKEYTWTFDILCLKVKDKKPTPKATPKPTPKPTPKSK